jgi:regulator of protease activity HflC (stomatin/prohibitin superfamily)
MEALRRQMAAEQQRAADTLVAELDRLDKEWSNKAALKVRPGRGGV